MTLAVPVLPTDNGILSGTMHTSRTISQKRAQTQMLKVKQTSTPAPLRTWRPYGKEKEKAARPILAQTSHATRRRKAAPLRSVRCAELLRSPRPIAPAPQGNVNPHRQFLFVLVCRFCVLGVFLSKRSLCSLREQRSQAALLRGGVCSLPA